MVKRELKFKSMLEWILDVMKVTIEISVTMADMLIKRGTFWRKGTIKRALVNCRKSLIEF